MHRLLAELDFPVGFLSSLQRVSELYVKHHLLENSIVVKSSITLA